jgi:methyl-galactoside transport system substrate-binding protein
MTGTIKQDAVAMAKGIIALGKNITGIAFDLTQFNVDKDVNKVRIPYGIYTGE